MANLTDENFEKEILSADKLVLVDFYADWCEPCRILAPILEKLSDDFEKDIILMKANTNNVPIFSQRFGIEQIPTVILFKKGRPISGFVGVSNYSAIKKWLENIIKENDNSEGGKKEKFDSNPSDNIQNNASWHSSTVEGLIKEFAEYAQKNNAKLNPDKNVIERVARGLLENEKIHGKKYCPCQRITGKAEENEKKICPCYYYKKNKRCFCGLFLQ